MSDNFYDKVAKKLGGYGYGNDKKVQYISEYPIGNPEEIFKEKLLGLSSKDKTALDIGCADGKFTLSVAPFFQKVFGIDTSRINLDIAKSHSNDERSKNVEYSLQDASRTQFEDSFFDLAYCRRGPSFHKEYHRILKTGGHHFEIGIGEKDAMKLKEIFGRGQNYGKWDNSTLEQDLKELQTLGFRTVFAEDFNYFEYYPSYKDFDLFLQGVPIFEDFDSEKDKKLLQRYVEKFTTDKGIQLLRHRLVMVVQKIN